MSANTYKKIFYFCIAFALMAGFNMARAESGFSKVNDMISKSWPNSYSNHLFKFKVHTDIPGSGKIRIVFGEAGYIIPGDLNFLDIDLAVADAISGPFTNRPLFDDFSGGSDSVIVNTAGRPSIAITLNPSNPIMAGQYVEIKVGNNAFFGSAGNTQILNPPLIGSYKIDLSSHDSSGRLLDRAEIMTAIVEPVSVSASQVRFRANGMPQGALSNMTETIMSLTTNLTATCSYSMIPDTDYDSMTSRFSYTGDWYHSALITGLAENNWYTYYVKCWWIDGYKDVTDYVINFYVKTPNEGDDEGGEGTGGGTGDDEGAGGESDVPGSGPASGGIDRPGSGGGGGGGSGGGSGVIYGQSSTGLDTGVVGQYPFEDLVPPDLVIDGLAYPNSEVYILKDGVLGKTIFADSQGKFKANIGNLKESVYTFNVWAVDSAKRKSITKSTTFWIKADTVTVAKIFLPPTIAVNSNSIKLGDSLAVYGETLPLRTVEAWFDNPLKNLVKKEVIASNKGIWNLDFNTGELPADGNYYVRARAMDSLEGFSDFSFNLNFGVGQSAEEELNTCQRADMNKDAKVNLIDFSILLYNWGKTIESADINLDGKINLVDFSMMMYCWTG